MKVAEGSARVDPQPVAKRRSEAAVQHEGLTLQPVPVQGEHQVLVDLLVQRMFPGQRVQFRRHEPVSSGDPVLGAVPCPMCGRPAGAAAVIWTASPGEDQC